METVTNYSEIIAEWFFRSETKYESVDVIIDLISDILNLSERTHLLYNPIFETVLSCTKERSELRRMLLEPKYRLFISGVGNEYTFDNKNLALGKSTPNLLEVMINVNIGDYLEILFSTRSDIWLPLDTEGNAQIPIFSANLGRLTDFLIEIEKMGFSLYSGPNHENMKHCLVSGYLLQNYHARYPRVSLEITRENQKQNVAQLAMSVNLVPVNAENQEQTLDRIARFFGYHAGLVGAEEQMARAESLATLQDWQSEQHELRVIEHGGQAVGFVHVWFKGPIVTWIEDLWVDEAQRGQGIASAAIHAVEDWMRADFPKVEAVSMEVAPRNENALRLYHRLGYDAISLITLRKELGGNQKRDQETEFLSKKWKF